MSIWDYNYPNFPNATTRQNLNELQQGKETGIEYSAPSKAVQMNVSPNPYNPQGNIGVYGDQVFGTGKDYADWGQSQDINHHTINQIIEEDMIYRRHLGTPYRASRPERLFAASNTAPSQTATFLDGKRGDVYGA